MTRAISGESATAVAIQNCQTNVDDVSVDMDEVSKADRDSVVAITGVFAD
ncbi:MAG: hypothetical protein WBB15_00300 [Ornithinimicrobium sp.]